MIKPADWLRELAFPLINVGVALSMIITWLLLTLALAFGLFGLGILIVSITPLTRYLMAITQERAAGHDAPVFDAEHMGFVGNFWTMFPLVLVAIGTWSTILVQQKFGPGTAQATALVFSLVFPACVGVLAITRSTLQSINPIALYHFIRKTLANYIVMILLIGLLQWAYIELAGAGVSDGPLRLFGLYQLYVAYSVVGAITFASRLKDDVSIPLPAAPTEDESNIVEIKERENAATHAYGFATRGNREGALQHIRQFIDDHGRSDEIQDWFFNEMLKWDKAGNSNDAALFFAQDFLHQLLLEEKDLKAMKLLSRCLYENPQFRPASSDRPLVEELVSRHSRVDLAELLR